MKRKAIQLANQTIVVSLPIKWVKQQGIKKGDELDVEEKGKDIWIKSKKYSNIRRTTIDVTKLNNLINRSILGAYIYGIDEINIIFNNVSIIRKIQNEIMNSIIGFEIVEQSKNNCIIKNISADSNLELNDFLKRIFFLLESMGDELVESIKNKETNLESIVSMDYNINKFSNFCLRYLNKYGYLEYYKTTSIYSIIQGLEHIGDLYKKIAQEIMEKKLKPNDETINVLVNINSLLKQNKTLFFKFEEENAEKIVLNYREIKKDIKNIQKKDILFYLNELNRTIIKELLGNQLTIR